VFRPSEFQTCPTFVTGVLSRKFILVIHHFHIERIRSSPASTRTLRAMFSVLSLDQQEQHVIMLEQQGHALLQQASTLRLHLMTVRAQGGIGATEIRSAAIDDASLGGKPLPTAMAFPVGSEESTFDRAVSIWKRFEYLHGGKPPNVLGDLEYADGLVVKAAGFKAVRNHARALRREGKESIRGVTGAAIASVAAAPADRAADTVVIPDTSAFGADAEAILTADPVAAAPQKRKKRSGRK
jgi:hypothetical protein